MNQPLKAGDPAPDFQAKDQHGNAYSLSDFKGKKLALYFYPKDNTPGCTAQACNLRDHFEALQDQGITILGVSVDDARSHQRFSEKHQLPFPLLIDTDKKLVHAYGVWQLKKFMGREYMGTLRRTFLIDESGVIHAVIEKVKTKDHAAQILAEWER